MVSLILALLFITASVALADEDHHSDSSDERKQLELDHPLLQEKIFFDGHLFKSNLTDVGPISSKIREANPRLTFLGSYGGYNWYIERTLVSQTAARTSCTNLGMTLGRPRNLAELDWITSVTTGGDDYSWTDGRNFRNHQGFLWDNQNSIPTGIQLVYTHSLGLVIDRYSSNSKLSARHSTETHYYLCYL